MRRLVVLRPEPGASATVERALRLGLDAVALPLFEIEAIAWEPPDPGDFDGLLLTSANAVRQGGSGLASLLRLPVHAVGEATAEAARSAGFDIATIGDDGAGSLLESLPPNLRLLHLCGADRTELNDVRQAITPLIVYRSVALDRPLDGTVSDSVTLVHSPRAAARFAELVTGPDRASVTIAAISPAAAQAAGAGWKRVEAAERPADEALLALAAELCNNGAGR